MGFNPEHHYRKSIRLTDYDYSSPGAYFVTICSQNRLHYFGEIVDGIMVLNSAGKMVDVTWRKIPEFYPNVALGAYVVMPNHIHGLIHLTNLDPNFILTYGARSVGADPRVCPDLDATTDYRWQQNPGQTQGSAPTQRVSLPGLVQRFKAITTKHYADGVMHHGWPAFDRRLWQRNYHEHVVRSERAYLNIAGYIEANPLRWQDDVYHTPLQNDPVNFF